MVTAILCIYKKKIKGITFYLFLIQDIVFFEKMQNYILTTPVLNGILGGQLTAGLRPALPWYIRTEITKESGGSVSCIRL